MFPAAHFVASNTDIQQVFQSRMKETRLKRGLSQRELGALAGLDPFVASARVNRYEVGVHMPDLVTAGRLAAALEVPLPYLFAADERLARAILAFDKLSARQKDHLLGEWERDGG